MAVRESVSNPLMSTTPTRSWGLKKLPLPRSARTIPDSPMKKKTTRVVTTATGPQCARFHEVLVVVLALFFLPGFPRIRSPMWWWPRCGSAYNPGSGIAPHRSPVSGCSSRCGVRGRGVNHLGPDQVSHLEGRHFLLIPALLRDVDEALDAFLHLDEEAEIGDVGDGARDDGPMGNAGRWSARGCRPDP